MSVQGPRGTRRPGTKPRKTRPPAKKPPRIAGRNIIKATHIDAGTSAVVKHMMTDQEWEACKAWLGPGGNGHLMGFAYENGVVTSHGLVGLIWGGRQPTRAPEDSIDDE